VRFYFPQKGALMKTVMTFCSDVVRCGSARGCLLEILSHCFEGS
jgi:hypothetical protein